MSSYLINTEIVGTSTFRLKFFRYLLVCAISGEQILDLYSYKKYLVSTHDKTVPKPEKRQRRGTRQILEKPCLRCWHCSTFFPQCEKCCSVTARKFFLAVSLRHFLRWQLTTWKRLVKWPSYKTEWVLVLKVSDKQSSLLCCSWPSVRNIVAALFETASINGFNLSLLFSEHGNNCQLRAH